MSSSSSKRKKQSWKFEDGRRKSKKAKEEDFITSGAILRVLCPLNFIGNVIGKGGGVISQMRLETGALIKVQDALPGCLERVILFVGCEEQSGYSKLKISDCDEFEEDKNNDDDDEDGKRSEENDVDKGDCLSRDGKVESNISSAQKALLKAFDKIIEEEKAAKECGDWGDKPYITGLKLVVFGSQADCLKSIDGGAFEKISSESGTRICFRPNYEGPSCIFDSDEVVQISGEINGIKKGIIYITHCILENPPRTSELSQLKILKPPSSSSAQTHTPKDEARHGGRIRDSGDYRTIKMSNDIIKMSVRLLCPEIKAGAVIGRGGSVVKGLQQDTGCEIDVSDRQVDADERIILITGSAHPDDRISPIQDGVLRVQARIVRSPPESNEAAVTARLLVPSSQIRALIGNSGAILAEITRLSRAQVHILGKEQLPKRVSLNDDLVQINGEFEEVQEALLHITAQLQHQFFNICAERGASHQLVLPLPPRGGFNSTDEPSPFMHNIQRLGVPLHILERNSSPASWGPEGLLNGDGRMGLPDYVVDPIRRLPLGIPPTIITNTTVEVVVPSSVIPSIYGESGGCLQQIRQISDAMVIIADPELGATETLITISGTPEQTNAAQSLIQAFVICESQS